VTVTARAVTAVLSPPSLAVVMLKQRGHVRGDPQDHRSPRATVATVGASEWLELLAVDRSHAVAAPTSADVQPHPVDECRNRHERRTSLLPNSAGLHMNKAKGRPEAGTPLSSCLLRRRQASSPGTMFTTRRPRRLPNCTAPAVRANSVSSPPR